MDIFGYLYKLNETSKPNVDSSMFNLNTDVINILIETYEIKNTRNKKRRDEIKKLENKISTLNLDFDFSTQQSTLDENK